MSQTTQRNNQSSGRFGGRRDSRPGDRPRRPRKEHVEPEWIPKTI